MTTPTQQPDIAHWAAAEEGQFFERKSAWDRSGSRPKQRKAADIARDVSETLAAMANADGGELVIGMEDDGTLSGVPHAPDKLRLLLGAPIEVWMYDDRMEIRSPGLPPAPVTIEALNRRKRVHFSRNPMLVRVLSDLQYMRDVGEGVPRIFDEMDRAGCYPPRFEMVGGFVFQVTLRNEPIYDRKTLEWLKQFAEVELSGDQKRMLAYAHAHGDRFTSREFQKVIGTDIYGASNAIKDMIRKGAARSTAKGSRVYEVRQPLKAHPDAPKELANVLPVLQRQGSVSNADVRRMGGFARNTAARILSDLVAAEWLVFSGKKGLGAKYCPGPRLLHHPPIARESRETGAMGRETGAMEPEK